MVIKLSIDALLPKGFQGNMNYCNFCEQLRMRTKKFVKLQFWWNTCFNLMNFFEDKSIMNTKGMSLLASVFQGNINYCPQSSDSILGFWKKWLEMVRKCPFISNRLYVYKLFSTSCLIKTIEVVNNWLKNLCYLHNIKSCCDQK